MEKMIEILKSWEAYATIIFSILVIKTLALIKKINNSASKEDLEKSFKEAKDYTDKVSYEQASIMESRFDEIKEMNQKTYDMVFFLYQKKMEE